MCIVQGHSVVVSSDEVPDGNTQNMQAHYPNPTSSWIRLSNFIHSRYKQNYFWETFMVLMKELWFISSIKMSSSQQKQKSGYKWAFLLFDNKDYNTELLLIASSEIGAERQGTK